MFEWKSSKSTFLDYPTDALPLLISAQSGQRTCRKLSDRPPCGLYIPLHHISKHHAREFRLHSGPVFNGMQEKLTNKPLNEPESKSNETRREQLWKSQGRQCNPKILEFSQYYKEFFCIMIMFLATLNKKLNFKLFKQLNILLFHITQVPKEDGPSIGPFRDSVKPSRTNFFLPYHPHLISFPQWASIRKLVTIKLPQFGFHPQAGQYQPGKAISSWRFFFQNEETFSQMSLHQKPTPQISDKTGSPAHHAPLTVRGSEKTTHGLEYSELPLKVGIVSPERQLYQQNLSSVSKKEGGLLKVINSIVSILPDLFRKSPTFRQAGIHWHQVHQWCSQSVQCGKK